MISSIASNTTIETSAHVAPAERAELHRRVARSLESQDGADPDPDADGDPGDNGDPTPFTLVLSVIEIPTLGEFGLGALAVLLAAAARRRLRRR